MSSLTGAHEAFRSALGVFELAQSGDARVTDLVAPATLFETVEDAATRVMQTPAQDLEDVLIKFDVLSAWYFADVWLDHRLDDRAARAYRIATVELGEFAARLRCRQCGKLVLG